jgi:arylsulfatase A-like enzyme
MPPGSDTEPVAAEAPPCLRVASGLLGAGLLIALVDAGAIAATLPLPASGYRLRAAHHLFDAAETVGLAAFAGLVAGVVAHLLRRLRWAGFALAVLAVMAVVHATIAENLLRGVQFTALRRVPTLGSFGYHLVLSLAIVLGYQVAAQMAERRWLRALPVVLALIALVGDHVPFRDDYHGVHGIVAIGAAGVGGAGLAPVIERWIRALRRTARGRIALGVGAASAALGVLVPPPNAVRYELFRQPCAVAPWALATVLWRAPGLHGPTPAPPESPWFHDRSGDPAVPPSSPRLMPDRAVVVLITIDAVRADAVADPANAALFPTFTALARSGVTFTRAMAPATQTPLTLATVFSGRAFSEQLWTDHGEGVTRFLYPADDRSVRFPEVLAAQGVATFDMAGLIFLANEYGVLRGFSEQHVPVKGARHAHASELIDPILARLRHGVDKPTFLCTHLLEPHEPYDRGRKDGTPYERYLSEIAVADAYVGRVLALLQTKYGNRWALFVSSDHGEAFGEHGTHEHAKSLYQELVHVPLFAASPLFPPRRVDERVTLVDLGPTILDLFGLATPATFLGQSLAPILAGGTAELTRPLFAEGRLRRSLVTPEGLEVIEDQRRKLVEVYDLTTDPGETRNLFDADPVRGDAALATLRAFFAAHTRREGGYEVPFKP